MMVNRDLINAARRDADRVHAFLLDGGSMMFGQFARGRSTQSGDIERRLMSLEHQLGRVGSRAAAGASHASNGLGDTIASVLSHMAGRFSGGRSMSDEAVKFGNEATKFGNDALRRLSQEVGHRPLVTLAIAIGVGILAGAMSRR